MMSFKSRDILIFSLLILFLAGCMLLDLFAGQLDIHLADFYNALFHFDPSNSDHIIAREFRLPRLIMALIAGAGLSVSGMFMQTLFNNPLAGPYVLGINSGSSLLVALSLMTGFSFFSSDLGTIIMALLGALIFGFIILGFSFFVRSHLSLLLIGLMLGSFTGAIISVLQSTSSAQELKAFTMWTMGSLQQTELHQIPLIILMFGVASIASLFLIKPLNAMVLGERSSESLGINLKRTRIGTIAVTALFTGLVTAFCGPIAFVGLAVPNLTRMLFRTQSHGKLLLANLLVGSIFLTLCDSIIQLMESTITIPINAFTSIIGAPLIILLVIKRLK